MKRLLLASIAIFALAGTPAVGADLPYKGPAPVVAPAPYWSWTGIYIGGHAGASWGTKEWSDPDNAQFIGTSNITGFLGGGQLGFNYQLNNWLVLGAEGDWSWTNADGRFPCTFAAGFTDTCNTKVNWYATAIGRLGVVVDRALVYTGFGGAWVKERFTDTDNAAFLAQATATNSGWTWVAGVEYAFAPNWSGKIQYNYLDFGTKRISLIPNDGTGPINEDIRQRVHVIKMGLNYRFDFWGTGPVHARY